MVRPMKALLAILLAALSACGGKAEAEHTNVVLIVVDTLRADHVIDAQGNVTLPRLASWRATA
jgi:membrane-anchored protein YejM (alkaline phosphatase superfamily)